MRIDKGLEATTLPLAESSTLSAKSPSRDTASKLEGSAPHFNLSINQRLVAGYALLVLLVVGIAAFAFKATHDISESYHRAARLTLPLVDTLNALRMAGIRVVASTSEWQLQQDDEQRNERSSGSDTESDLIAVGKAQYQLALERYRSLSHDLSPTATALAARIHNAGAAFIQAGDILVERYQARAESEEIMAAKETFEEREATFLAALDDAIAHTNQKFTDNSRNVDQAITLTQDTLVLASLLVFILTCIIGFIIARSISRPISELNLASREIGAGNLRARAKVQANDELGQLAETFNTMISRLNISRVEITAARDHLDEVIACMVDALIVTDAYGLITRVNAAAGTLSDYAEQELLGKPVAMIVEDLEHLPDIAPSVTQAPLHQETWVRTRDGKRVHTLISRSVLRNNAGTVLLLSDMTERKQAEKNLQFMATHDLLTDLPNRILFTDRLEQALARAPWRKRQVGVLLLDLDRFKVINNTLGHEVGDALLQAAAARLSTCVRAGDTVARLGGDEFALVLTDMAHAEDALNLAQKVISGMAEPFHIDGRELFLTASAGISIYPDDGDHAVALLRHADTALYRAKDQGKNTFCVYSPALGARAAENMTMETDLRRALERNELELHYQPQVNINSGGIVGMEALLRWHHPERGYIPPLDFIPLAEETGLMVAIGAWVLHSACQQTQRWHEAGHTQVRVAVNLSNRQFMQADLLETIQDALRESGLGAENLEIELTESIIMQDAEGAIATLRALKDMGVKLSIDDFGTGYSSLTYLKRFPLHTLKIDRSFVKDIPYDADDAAITAAIIAMAHNLRLTVVAEGVEDAHQLEFLREQRCDMMQGYYFSKPLSVSEFSALLQQHRN